MKSCYIYARTATITQQWSKRKRSSALINQIKACKSYAEKNGFQPLQIFEDVGSGNKINEELKNLLAFCNSCPPDAVIVNSADRLARSTAIYIRMCEEFKEKKIKLLSVREGDMSSNSFMGNIFAAVAKWEYEIKKKHKK